MAFHGAAARRRGGPGLGHPHEPERVGGVGPPGQLQRSPGGLPRLQGALAGRPHRGPVPELRIRRPDRGPAVQHDVQDVRGTGGGRGLGGLPAAGDGAGHLRQLHEHGADHTQEATVRRGPGGQVVPQRDHAGQLRVPHARVRADGDGVLRAARRGRQVVRVLVPGATEVVHRARHPGREPEAPSSRARRAQPLLHGYRRHRVPLPVGMGRARGHRPAHRLRPHPARPALGPTARVLRPGQRGALRPSRGGAGRRPQPAA